jgi:CubicO group peptidase (beta-lactamase class C family)
MMPIQQTTRQTARRRATSTGTFIVGVLQAAAITRIATGQPTQSAVVPHISADRAISSALVLARDARQRRQRVEQSLVPNVPVAGADGWRLIDRMRFHRVPGLSIAVVHEGRVDWVGAYGLADTLRRTPVTPSTLFSAGSVSKFATAVLAMRLAQSGAVSLTAPVNAQLRSWQLPETEQTRRRPVTLELLLSHRAGTSQSSYFGFVPQPQPYPGIVEILRGAPGTGSRAVVVNQPVDSGFAYSGGGYMVAQLALTDATRTAPETFAQLAADSLFRPLGMRSTTFEQPLPPSWQARAAWAYSSQPWFRGMPYVYPQQAAAGLYTTAEDLARLIVEVQHAISNRGALLDSTSARSMLTARADVSRGEYVEQIGLGAFLLRRSSSTASARDAETYFEHTGVNAGFVTYLIGSITGGNGVVVMMNADGGATELGKEIRRAVARVYNWPQFVLDPVRVSTSRAVTRATIASVAGRYQRGPDEVITFRSARAPRPSALPREHVAQIFASGVNVSAPLGAVVVGLDSIGFTDFPGTAVIIRDGAGVVTGLRMPYGASLARMPAHAFTPGELLRAGRHEEARAAYAALIERGAMSEAQLTYMVYELLHRAPYRARERQMARTLLATAEARYPNSSMVQARWGEYYARDADTVRATAAYERALLIDSTDTDIRSALHALRRR